MDINVHLSGLTADSKRVGFALESILCGPVPFHNGASEYGISISVKLRDLETDNVDKYLLVFNFNSGEVYLRDSLRRLGFVYQIKCSENVGQFSS